VIKCDDRKKIYSSAHKLAELLRNSEEYNQYMLAKEKLYTDENSANALFDLRQQQMQLQIAEMMGKEVEKTRETLDEMYIKLSSNPDVNNFLNSEYKFVRMVNNIQKIFGDTLDIWPEEENEIGVMNNLLN